MARAEALLCEADAIQCRKYVTPKAIVQGNPKLNVAFIANLFNMHPGLAPLEAAAQAELDDKLFGSFGDREARAFALWMNSLGVEPFVHNLLTDLRDGRVLLRILDKIQPGIVDTRKGNWAEGISRFKAIENTNYVVTLAKTLRLSLVGIQGADLTDGRAMLTLALVWQLMRHHVTQTLRSIKKDGADIADAELIAWANAKVAASPNKRKLLNEGEPDTMSSFRDSALISGRYLLALLDSLKPGTVQRSLVCMGDDPEKDYKQNAKYAISAARMMGASLFILPEDILEAKPKMILTFIGSLMAVEASK
jgi:plastin-1